MAVSAFKSTSKRGNFGTTSSNATSSSARNGNSDDLSKKVTHRRSRSVTALSRTSSSSSIVDFLNKRDNPLFCSSNSSPPNVEHEMFSKVSKFDQKVSKFDESPQRLEGRNSVSDDRRGRSVVRNSECGNKFGGGSKEKGRQSTQDAEDDLSRGGATRFPRRKLIM